MDEAQRFAEKATSTRKSWCLWQIQGIVGGIGFLLGLGLVGDSFAQALPCGPSFGQVGIARALKEPLARKAALQGRPALCKTPLRQKKARSSHEPSVGIQVCHHRKCPLLPCQRELPMLPQRGHPHPRSNPPARWKHSPNTTTSEGDLRKESTDGSRCVGPWVGSCKDLCDSQPESQGPDAMRS